MICHRLRVLVSISAVVAVAVAGVQLTKEQVYALLSEANTAFRQGSLATSAAERNSSLEQAILLYRQIIEEHGIENPKLYYNLANAYLVNGDIGRAILNYRRAERLDSTDTNIQKNLAFARSRRLDRVSMEPEEQVLQTLFFWHYDLSLRARFLTACLLFGAVCLALTVIVWRGRNTLSLITVSVGGILLLCLLVSIIAEVDHQRHSVSGVIVAREIVARQGDALMYEPSYRQPLHAGTEFEVIEKRPGWLHIKLVDGSDAWIPENAAEII